MIYKVNLEVKCNNGAGETQGKQFHSRKEKTPEEGIRVETHVMRRRSFSHL